MCEVVLCEEVNAMPRGTEFILLNDFPPKGEEGLGGVTVTASSTVSH